MKNKLVIILSIMFFASIICSTTSAIDTELTRRTISGLQGVNVIVEEMQPNIQRYSQKTGLTKEQIQTDVETKLRSAGIKVFTLSEWQKTPGRPVFYVNINTHEYERYWYAYNINLELRQIVSLEANPSLKTLASTWSIEMTGTANIGTLSSIRNNVGSLVDKFVEACRAANQKK